ncbi:MarR family transcriptional regulator [Candidatus Saccharibacteria bacterium]|nr:MarR family transcriptional regulator [Candidatus Saccharibacteria bacterium]
MATITTTELRQQLAVAAREQGIRYTLFRNAIGKQLGLHTTDFEGLDLVFYRGVATPSELSQYTGLSSGSTTTMIDRLEKAGLVTRTNNPHDRRGTHVSVTTSARIAVGPLFTSARVAQNELIASYSKDELVVLNDYFTRSAAMFEQERTKVLGESPVKR